MSEPVQSSPTRQKRGRRPSEGDRARCPTCGRLHREDAKAKLRRQILAWLPPDTHERVGRLLNVAYQAGETDEPAAVLLLAFQQLEMDLMAQGYLREEDDPMKRHHPGLTEHADPA